MAYEPRPGSFSLFRNDKEGNDNRPDYTGDGLDPDGKPIKISAWIKEGKNGKFMSCRMEPKTRGEAPTNPQRSPAPEQDVPF